MARTIRGGVPADQIPRSRNGSPIGARSVNDRIDQLSATRPRLPVQFFEAEADAKTAAKGYAATGSWPRVRFTTAEADGGWHVIAARR